MRERKDLHWRGPYQSLRVETVSEKDLGQHISESETDVNVVLNARQRQDHIPECTHGMCRRLSGRLAFRGSRSRGRLLMAGNQVGKFYAGAMEVAIHATGRYPEWWKGYRFDRPVRAWCCGESNEVVRESLQKLLLGEPGAFGKGSIPKDALLDIVPARGTPDLVDTIRVKCGRTGGPSTIQLKSYSQGRERFQGATLDLAYCDEEPPADVFHEILTRLNVTGGPLMLTFTPLLG